MMTTLKKTIFVVAIIEIIFFLTGCGNSGSIDKNISDSLQSTPAVNLYYLHQKKGCPTCKAIGEVVKSTTEQNFSTELKNKTIIVSDLDIADPANTALATKFECTWSGLYLCSYNNNKEVVEDLTDVAFMYAVTKPDTIKTILNTKISYHLNK